MKYLILIFIIIPALEIGLFILAGNTIGVLATISLIILTGLLGAYLAKKQGLDAVRNVQQQIQAGQPPGMAMLDGLCILTGGLMLLTPGFITDLFGFVLLIPYTRKFLRPLLMHFMKKWVDRHTFYMYRR